MARVTIGLCLGMSALILTLSTQPARANGTSIVVNGGFETGDLTGWTETGDNATIAVPEPSTLVLLGTGLVAVMALALKKSAG